MGDLSHWNYRVIRTEVSEEEYEFCIYEVWYDGNGNIEMWCESPNYPMGDGFLQLQNDLNYMVKATQKPILEEKEIDGELKLIEIKV